MDSALWSLQSRGRSLFCAVKTFMVPGQIVVESQGKSMEASPRTWLTELGSKGRTFALWVGRAFHHENSMCKGPGPMVAMGNHEELQGKYG
jgi:hypothetical protein